jgi:hypothetical protein
MHESEPSSPCTRRAHAEELYGQMKPLLLFIAAGEFECRSMKLKHSCTTFRVLPAETTDHRERGSVFCWRDLQRMPVLLARAWALRRA